MKRDVNTRGTLKWTVLVLVIGGTVAYLYWAPRHEAGLVPWPQGAAATPRIPVPPAARGPIPGMPAMPSRAGIPGFPLTGARTMDIVDLNSASLSQLETLPGMTPDYAQKIIAGRPFHGRADLERAGIPRDVFDTMSPPAMIKFVGTEGPSTLPAPDAAPVNRRGTKP